MLVTVSSTHGAGQQVFSLLHVQLVPQLKLVVLFLPFQGARIRPEDTESIDRALDAYVNGIKGQQRPWSSDATLKEKAKGAYRALTQSSSSATYQMTTAGRQVVEVSHPQMVLMFRDYSHGFSLKPEQYNMMNKAVHACCGGVCFWCGGPNVFPCSPR